MFQPGLNGFVRIVDFDGLCDLAVIGYELGHPLFFFHPQHAQPINLSLFFKNDVEGVVGLCDLAQGPVEIIVELAKPFDVFGFGNGLLLDQLRIQLCSTHRVALGGSPVKDLRFDRGADKAGLLNLTHREASYFRCALWANEQEIKVGKATESIPNRLPRDAEVRGDLGLGYLVTRLELQRGDLLVKVIEYIVNTGTTFASSY